MNSRFLIFLYATAFISLGSARGDRTDRNNDPPCNCGKRQEAKIVSSRIINGTKAPPEHWPWVVGIYDSTDTLVCGGSLINEEYVVTAVHCFVETAEDPLMYGTSRPVDSCWCGFLAGQATAIKPERPSLFVKVSPFLDSLISKFVQPGNHTEKNATCATEDARKKCVTKGLSLLQTPLYNYKTS
uniref:Putative trypsin-like serine protease n=2 Tax=Ixodes ricinus TaxID=34613 RepID=A0A090X7J1_IXORI